MTKISANMFFWKRLEPIGAVTLFSSFIVYELLDKGFQVSSPRILLPFVLLVWTIFIHIRFVSDLVSFVYDNEKCLIIENGNIKDSVMYSNIKEVECFAHQAPRKVTLHLIQPSKFGKKYYFRLMRLSAIFFERTAVVETLIEKIEKS